MKKTKEKAIVVKTTKSASSNAVLVKEIQAIKRRVQTAKPKESFSTFFADFKTARVK